MIYLITRHPGALQWLQQKLSEPAVHLEHLNDPDLIGPGDIVVGTLPINLVAAICCRGARYLHLELELPQSLRGQELSVQQLNELGAALVEYAVLQVSDDASILQRAQELEDY